MKHENDLIIPQVHSFSCRFFFFFFRFGQSPVFRICCDSTMSRPSVRAEAGPCWNNKFIHQKVQDLNLVSWNILKFGQHFSRIQSNKWKTWSLASNRCVWGHRVVDPPEPSTAATQGSSGPRGGRRSPGVGARDAERRAGNGQSKPFLDELSHFRNDTLRWTSFDMDEQTFWWFLMRYCFLKMMIITVNRVIGDLQPQIV